MINGRCMLFRMIRVAGGVTMALTLFVMSTYTAVCAQSVAVVGSRNRVNPSNEDWQESSVAARLTDHDELVVAANKSGATGIYYGVSVDGGSSFNNGFVSWQADPSVAVDPQTDRIWISALDTGFSHSYVSGAWKEPSDTGYDEDQYGHAANEYVLVDSCFTLDRATLRILSDGRHVLTLVRNHDTPDGCSDPADACILALWNAFSDAPYDQDTWTDLYRIEPDIQNNGCRWEGWGVKPVELDSGRIVVTFLNYQGGGYNNNLPVVAYSDDGGETWLPNDILPVPVADSATSLIEPIEGLWASGSGDTPYTIDRRKCAPDIAVDHSAEPDDVYVAFYARAVREDTDSGDHNSDVYISRTNDAEDAISFPGNNDAYLVQLTDDMLGLEADEDGPDQIMPSIAIDPCGGVNLVFYDNRNDPDRSDSTEILDVYFVRITGYGDTNDIQQVRLTPNSFTLPTSGFLGDYHNMALAGSQPTLYPAWIAIHNSHQNCYVNKIAILCSGELSSYRGEEESSCDLFERLYEDGTIDGDLNGDEVVDSEDEAIFAALIEGLKE